MDFVINGICQKNKHHTHRKTKQTNWDLVDELPWFILLLFFNIIQGSRVASRQRRSEAAPSWQVEPPRHQKACKTTAAFQSAEDTVMVLSLKLSLLQTHGRETKRFKASVTQTKFLLRWSPASSSQDHKLACLLQNISWSGCSCYDCSSSVVTSSMQSWDNPTGQVLSRTLHKWFVSSGMDLNAVVTQHPTYSD